MITYKGYSVTEVFQAAAQDEIWTEEERVALAEIAEGLRNNYYNQLLIGSGKWDGTEERLHSPRAFSENFGTGRIYCVPGGKFRFYCHESVAGHWNIGIVGIYNC
ncbi:hypothetical protein [Synergistes jonesii]|uniref:hypothetical protein n=1 Tax=Synergistes jonesii TaxID=2754 RepID=UPI0024318090|nr:hypothetical protein [Synergistes jonesii]